MFSQCPRCLVNSSIEGVTIDSNGCNYCNDFYARKISNQPSSSSTSLCELIASIKSSSRHSKYDCVIGISGGIDSSWVLVEAVRQGLKPLAVHMDNTWNSNICQSKSIKNSFDGMNWELIFKKN